MKRSQNRLIFLVQLQRSADPVAVPTRHHACSREPRPDRRRRGSYPLLPPRLNPSPKPSTMASKLLNSNGSNFSKEAEAKTCVHPPPPPPSRTKSQLGAVEHWSGRAHRYFKWGSGSEDARGERVQSLERGVLAGWWRGARRLLKWSWGRRRPDWR